MASTCVQGIISIVETNFRSSLNRLHIQEDIKFIDVRKKTRDLKSGDVIIPSGSIKLENTSQVEQILESLKTLLLHDESFVQKITLDNFSFLAFYLDRAKVFKAVFNEISQCGPQYGFKKQTEDSIILHTVLDRSIGASMTLNELRLTVVQSHSKRLLEANGYNVLCTDTVENLNTLLESIKLLQNNTEAEKNESSILHSNSELHLKLLNSFKLSGLNLGKIETLADQPRASLTGHLGESNISSTAEKLPDNLTMDLKQIIQERELCVGKDGFSKNICKIKLLEDGCPTLNLKDVLRETEDITRIAAEKPVCGCLHIVLHNQAYRQQQFQLIRLALLNQQLSESNLIVGPVTQKGKAGKETGVITAQSLYQSRYEQMKEASEMRYGCNIDAEEMERRVQLLTHASLKVDLLCNDAHNELQLEVCGSDRPVESRLGSFILYNTARLASLINQFEYKVSEGFYPPLPPVADVDFTSLREEEDWELLFLFIAEFPALVRHSVELVFPVDGRCLAKIHTHKVTKFLASFCKCLSAHYSRYHILSGGEEHLLPLMFARLHLMKSAHQVLLNCLHLLDIDALSEL
ncbi:hypothetical protein Btru_043541 [Bulinus truncatus]|nr:hypothetical protein Btru_043541 [Bulinus truncatus]